MKKFLFRQHTTLLVIAISHLACSNPGNQEIYSAAIAGNTKFEKLLKPDVRFLQNAYSVGLYKLGLANEAVIRSTSAEAVQLARAITVFNTEINSRIEKLAMKNRVILPLDLTDEQKFAWKQLVKEKGWNFDRKFGELVKISEATEKMVYNRASQTSNNNIKLLTQKIEPELQLHQTLIVTLIDKINEKNIVAAPLKEKSKRSKKPTPS